MYGEDANMDRPRRWTATKDEEKVAEMNRYADLVFSYGACGCLGKAVAFMEPNKAVNGVKFNPQLRFLYPSN